MAVQRMDNVGVVVDDLDTAIEFFKTLGMELEGTALIDGQWAARCVGLDEQTVDIAMMRTPDGHGRIELAKYRHPQAIGGVDHHAPVNTLGIRRIMFAVDDLDADLARLLALGAEHVGDVVQYEDTYRLCYIRGPEGIVIALAQQLQPQPAPTK